MKLTVADAVKVMREAGIKTGPDRVMAGIEQGVYPWGDCIKMRSPEYTVYGSRKEVRRLNRMKELREAKGLSKSAAAEAVGITVSAILKYEAGITQPSVYAAWKLARLYGVTIEEMMGYDGRKGD